MFSDTNEKQYHSELDTCKKYRQGCFFNKEVAFQAKSPITSTQLIPHITLCEPDVLIEQPDVIRHIGNSSIPDFHYVIDEPSKYKFSNKEKMISETDTTSIGASVV